MGDGYEIIERNYIQACVSKEGSLCPQIYMVGIRCYIDLDAFAAVLASVLSILECCSMNNDNNLKRLDENLSIVQAMAV